MKAQYRISMVLVILVILIWVLFDMFMKKETPFSKDSEYIFQNKSLQQIKTYAEKSFNDYLLSENHISQVSLLVNAIECNHFLLYANKLKVPRFYDFIHLILLPSQRGELKKKQTYVYEIKRYLRRKRNLEIKYLKYAISKPVIINEPGNTFLKIRVSRENTENIENLVYYFKKFKNRYYLYFKKRTESDTLPLYQPATKSAGGQQ